MANINSVTSGSSSGLAQILQQLALSRGTFASSTSPQGRSEEANESGAERASESGAGGEGRLLDVTA